MTNSVSHVLTIVFVSNLNHHFIFLWIECNIQPLTDIYTQHFMAPPHISIKSPPQNELMHMSNKSKPAGLFSLPSELQECNLLVWAVGFGIMLQFWAEVVPQLCASTVSARVALKVRTVKFSGSPPLLQLTLDATRKYMFTVTWKWQSSNREMNLDRFYKRPLTCTALCVYLHIHLDAACMKNNCNFISSRWLQVVSLVENPLEGCFEQTLKELATAQDCADICSTRISHACASSLAASCRWRVFIELLTYGAGWNGSRI